MKTISFPTVRAPNGVRYSTSPSASLIAQTMMNVDEMRPFLTDYDPAFNAYYQESVDALDNDLISDGGLLAKFSGQMCYLSLGELRTPHAEADKYFTNIMGQGHGSILEHAAYTVLLWGVDRAVTHEAVRHRAGMAYSQVSQRYVGEDKLRFCMPYDIQNDEALMLEALNDMAYDAERFSRWINNYRSKYPQMEGESKTEWRKRLQSASRRVLPNWVEAPIVITGNVRSWRHVLSMRCSKHADVAIRRAMLPVLKVLQHTVPELFADFVLEALPDGSIGASSKYIKV
jgi:thymidylate synthase (FAD)